MIIGLDVGGTHTDTVLLDENSLVGEHKIPTDSNQLYDTILNAIERTLEDVPAGRKVRRLVLSTTLTTNAVVEGKLDPVGMIVSPGPGMDPEAFRTGPFYQVAGAVMDHRGRETRPVDPAEIRSMAEGFLADGIRHVGVVGKFSVRNPAHELRICEILEELDIRSFPGHRLSGSLNFPRRIATTYLNTAVFPVHQRFYAAVENSLHAKGLDCPIHILKADGGTMSFGASQTFPAQTALSGPAASVMGACAFAPESPCCLVMDIGGTTTDMAVLVEGVPLMDPLGIEIGPHKTLIRALATQSIGIGGDSTVALENGRLTIGPRRLGPAMAYGGPAPTPTDALFVLRQAADGSREKAVAGFELLARACGTTVQETAQQVFAAAADGIMAEARGMIDRMNRRPVYTVHELLKGFVLQPREILLLGGPAPHFARHFESSREYRVTVVPKYGVANAIGAALARTTCEATLFADTEIGILRAPAEDFTRPVDRDFSQKDLLQTAFDLLGKKAAAMGAAADQMDMEIVEDSVFNMVRGFSTTGKIMRTKVQIKPGLLSGYRQRLQNII